MNSYKKVKQVTLSWLSMMVICRNLYRFRTSCIGAISQKFDVASRKTKKDLRKYCRNVSEKPKNLRTHIGKFASGTSKKSKKEPPPVKDNRELIPTIQSTLLYPNRNGITTQRKLSLVLITPGLTSSLNSKKMTSSSRAFSGSVRNLELKVILIGLSSASYSTAIDSCASPNSALDA